MGSLGLTTLSQGGWFSQREEGQRHKYHRTLPGVCWSPSTGCCGNMGKAIRGRASRWLTGVQMLLIWCTDGVNQIGIWLWSWIWKIIKLYWAPDHGKFSCINSVHLCSCKTTEHCQVPVIKRITVTFNYHKTSFILLEYTVESNTLYTVEY